MIVQVADIRLGFSECEGDVVDIGRLEIRRGASIWGGYLSELAMILARATARLGPASLNLSDSNLGTAPNSLPRHALQRSDTGDNNAL